MPGRAAADHPTMDDPIVFEKWRDRAEATVSMYVGFDVEFEPGDQRAGWTAKGHAASAHPHAATLTAVEYVPGGSVAEAQREQRHYPCTKDGARLAGEQIAEFLRTGRLAKE
jgi:hypothetical protein